MTATPKMQAHIDLAYARRQEPGNTWSDQDFWDQLSAAERVAVFAGNFNGQVLNGGFTQWHNNGYATPEVLGFLMRLCKRLGTETTLLVYDLLTQFEDAQGEFAASCERDADYNTFDAATEKLDSVYYAIRDDSFILDVEASL